MSAREWPGWSDRLTGLARGLADELSGALAAGAARTPWGPAGGGRWLGLWALLCLTVGLTLLAAGGYQGGFLRINAAASAWPPWVWQWLTSLGDERVPFALSLFFARARPRVFWALVLAALLAAAYSRGLKPLLDLPRPPMVLDPGSFDLIGPGHRRTSFPSGHSVAAGVFFGVLVYYGRLAETRTLLVLLAVLAGLSRVAVGVHWPADVAFGLLGGVLAAWGGARLAARWPAPATDPSIHLPLVALASVFAAALTLWDGGYPAARVPLALLGWGALGWVAIGYGLRPLRAVLLGRAAGGGRGAGPGTAAPG
jgi:membrane-associated phospholipid phosphatase